MSGGLGFLAEVCRVVWDSFLKCVGWYSFLKCVVRAALASTLATGSSEFGAVNDTPTLRQIDRARIRLRFADDSVAEMLAELETEPMKKVPTSPLGSRGTGHADAPVSGVV